MCGIVAMLSHVNRPDRRQVIQAMSDAISHRGPDSSGFFERDNVSFGFRRLAILDLSANGDQPMSSPDGNLTIIFNGRFTTSSSCGLSSRNMDTVSGPLVIRKFCYTHIENGVISACNA